jgi:hypothetical protein
VLRLMVIGKNLKHTEITECVLNMILSHDVVISSTAITYASIVSHSPYRAEVKNERSYNCFPPIYIYIYIYMPLCRGQGKTVRIITVISVPIGSLQNLLPCPL